MLKQMTRGLVGKFPTVLLKAVYLATLMIGKCVEQVELAVREVRGSEGVVIRQDVLGDPLRAKT